MDRLLALLNALAWPVATIVVLLVFRGDLARAMNRVGRLKFRDLEVTFQNDLCQAEEFSRSIPPPAKPSIILQSDTGEATELAGRFIGMKPEGVPTASAGSASTLKLAERSPRDAVETAWKVVVRALIGAWGQPTDRGPTELANPEAVAQFLVDQGRMDPGEAMLVGLLRKLRDRAGRPEEPAPSVDEAKRYVKLSTDLVARIEGRS